MSSSPSTTATVLVTGGSGYVGSHCVLSLLEHNYRVIVIDNLVNSVQLDNCPLPESLKRVEEITGKRLVKFYNTNIENAETMEKIFQEHSPIDVVMHFAALKAVAESISKPLLYYQNNVIGSIALLAMMDKFNVKKFIFSSSATVYGVPEYLPLDEKHPIGRSCANPYGRSKFMVEQILEDLCRSQPELSVISLRYFNPVGAHESGRIGEDPSDIPNNLMPYITQVATKRRPYLQVYGNDYETEDGTPIRDYIHITDLTTGHIAALREILNDSSSWNGYHPINLGTGVGSTVLQVIAAFEKVSGVHIPYKVVGRRAGDLCTLYADAQLAQIRLGWKATHTLEEMCSSAWNWQSNNPNGYRQYST